MFRRRHKAHYNKSVFRSSEATKADCETVFHQGDTDGR